MTSHVTDDGVRLHVEITGPDEAPTVVLVHGLAGSVVLGWHATGVLDRLTAAGLRTVAYDAREHGMSEAPHQPERYGDDRLAADLGGVVWAHAGPSTVVAGYSMGAATIPYPSSSLPASTMRPQHPSPTWSPVSPMVGRSTFPATTSPR